MRTRGSGFTLIELLVVIAIIAILAAMLFPVFARARESARKIQCLSNVKNIAIAINMYLTDYDAFPPSETRSEVTNYFDSIPGSASRQGTGIWNGTIGGHCGVCTKANPYLRWPTILDDYTKNRDIWRCPSAKIIGGASFIIQPTDWFNYLVSLAGEWGDDSPNGYWGPCLYAYPNGWGGTVTDSMTQLQLAVPSGSLESAAASQAFVQSIAVNADTIAGAKTSRMDDASSYVIVGDGSQNVTTMGPGLTAYPDLCNAECAGTMPYCDPWVDWEVCSAWASDCGLEYHAPQDGSFYNDRQLLKKYARHLGGVNVGFGDGHAQWFPSDTFLGMYRDGKLSGLWNSGPTSQCAPYPGNYLF
jgi:prepilin-type N-terminal cleavage/methylation domain-containing protein/prepilin-type processing-associated H-X9-DG protein